MGTEKATRAQTKPTNYLWLLLAITLVVGAAGLALFLLNRPTPVPPSWGSAGGPRDGIGSLLNACIQAVALPTVAVTFGVLILSKQPRQRIGRLLVAIGLYQAVTFAIAEWAVYGTYTSAGLPGAAAAAWITNWAWIFLMALTFLTVALFPNGRFLSSRWAWAISLGLLLFVVPGLIGTSMESPMSSAYQIPNPYFDISGNIYDLLFFIVVAAMLLTAALALLQMATRYRRSKGRERDQLKWLLAGVILSAFMIFAGIAMATDVLSQSAFRGDWISEAGAFMVNASVLAPLLGVGIAMVRFQLYDIDFIIRRTTSYAIVTAILAVVYLGSVVVLQSVFTSLTGQDSTIAIVLSTLLIAALFLPLRQRVQTVIDRRFFRQKYDAQKTLEAFAATVRDETDLDELTDELVRVIQETMQPEHVTVWLAPAEGREPDTSAGGAAD